jgi:hypothetical protein
MNEQLTDFLIDLASDPGRLASFAANPSAAVDEARLTDVQRTAILARDAAAIRRILAADDDDNGKGIKTAIRKGIKKKKPAKKKKKRPGRKK